MPKTNLSHNSHNNISTEHFAKVLGMSLICINELGLSQHSLTIKYDAKVAEIYYT